MAEVEDIVTQNEIISSFSKFITEETLTSFTTCSAIVGVMVESVKPITDVHPLILSFIFSFILNGLKLMLSGEYTIKNVILAFINVIPMALTASGGYDVIKKIYKSWT